MFTKKNLAIGGAVFATVLVVIDRAQTRNIEPTVRPQGDPTSITTKMLKFGSKILQSNAPLKGTDIYLVGFHPMKNDPCHQMEAHHYCKQVNEDFAQCIIYDGNTKNANLTGIEYVISEKLFEGLSTEEKAFWHPHNYEILSGQLIAKGLPSFAEKLLMKTKMNSYGKTFHTWRAKCWEGDKPFQDTLPLGPPLLGWSLNHDGEGKHDIVGLRDKNMSVNTTEIKKDRESLLPLAKPQMGVNYLAEKFAARGRIDPIPGVVDINEGDKKNSK